MMGHVTHTYGRKKKRVKSFVGKPEAVRRLERPSSRWEKKWPLKK